MPSIALSLVDSTNGYQQALVADARAAARGAGLDVDVEFCESDFPRQLEQLGSLLERNPAGLLAMAVHDRGLARVLKRAARAGVHCILLNETEEPLDEIRNEFPGAVMCHVCSDEEEAGRIQGRLARALAPDGGRLLLVEGTRRSLTARCRTSGLLEVLEGAGIEIDRLEAGWTAEEGEAASRRWLKIAIQFNRTLDLIVCHNDGLAAGVRKALEAIADDLGRPEIEGIQIVGCDGIPERGQAMVSEGSLTATVIQPRISRPAVESLVQVLAGGASPAPMTRLAGTAHPPNALLSPGGLPARIATIA